MNRRRFLQAVAAASTTPLWLRFADQAVNATIGEGVVRTKNGQLLVIFLEGGNDSLNTVVPYMDTVYKNKRPSIALGANEVLQMGNGMGLHPALSTLHQYWQAGQLAVVQQVGSPKNDFSHFSATEIWETASPDQRFVNGWLGRYLDATNAGASGPLRAVALTDVMPTTLESVTTGGVSLDSIIDYAFKDTDAPDAQLRHGTFRTYAESTAPVGSVRSAVIQGQRELADTLDPVAELSARYNPQGYSPSQGETVAQMFAAGVGTEVGFIRVGPFDTHTLQTKQHNGRLTEVDNIVRMFFSSAYQLGVADRSAVMIVSEFGRRVRQNSSYGTDHGDAGNVLLMGPKVRGGLYGPKLDLTLLTDGNVPVKIDLRNVYASVLEQWMGVSHTSILGGRFSTLPLFA